MAKCWGRARRDVWSSACASLVLGAACSGGNGDSLDSDSLGEADGGTRDTGVDDSDAGGPERDSSAPDADAPDDAGCDAGVSAAPVFDLATRSSADMLSESFYNSLHADITADGRYVVFASSEQGLVSPASNGVGQIFLRDRELGTTELVSARADGAPGVAASARPAISDDGCFVVFESLASDLVDNDTNAVSDVFLRDRCAATPVTTLVSVDRAGRAFFLASHEPDISADGSTITFDSDHPQGLGDIFLHVRSEGVSLAITAGSFASRSPAISADGTRIAFWSYADNLVVGDRNAIWDIFLYDTTSTPGITLVSASAAGAAQTQGNEGASTLAAPGISGDGHIVAFRSRGAGLVAEDNGLSQVYVKDTDTGEITIESVNDAGELGDRDSAGSGQGLPPSLSFDGSVVVFTSSAQNLAADTGTQSPSVIIRDRTRGETHGVPGFGGDDTPVVSGDAAGRYVASFAAAELDPRFAATGVFVLDREAPPVAVCE